MEALALHSHHERLGAAFGSSGGRELVLRYSDAPTEATWARQQAGLADLSSRGTVRLTGPDRVSFLHGMCTQDIQGMTEGSTSYAALLTAKGAMVADARVLRRKDELLLDVEPGLAPKVLEFLGRYLISEDAEVSDASAELGRLSLVGPATGAVLQAVLGISPPGPGRALETRHAGAEVWVTDPALPLREGGADLWAAPSLLAGLFSELLAAVEPHGLKPLGFEGLELLRVESGIPRYGVDMGDTTIPLEANLERALHYQKGCYIGQEVIARATFRGHMNRRLMGLKLGAALPPPQTELRSGDRKVGFLTSVVHSTALGENIALGYVHRDFLIPGTELSLAGGPEKARVAALPFSR